MKIPEVPPEGFLLAMPEEERQRLGRAGLTNEEARKKFEAGQEKELQRQVYQYLTLHDIYFEYDSMRKKTSGKRGRADFRLCVIGKWLSIET